MFTSFGGSLLVPGMGLEAYTTEHDNSDIFYGSIHLQTYLTYAVIDGSALDAGNTGYTTVLRPGLVMGQVTTGGKWKQWTTGASDGTQYARGILLLLGLNTQLAGANADRFLASILVAGIVNPEAMCIASTTGFGLPRTGVGVTIRKHFKYQFIFSDDFSGDLIEALSGR